jgi:acetyl-CoA synthetase (ADP-forming)
VESKALLKASGIPIVETRLAQSLEEAQRISRQLGFPVVLKVVSPDILHKSDIGGVRVGLKDEGEVATAYQEILQAAKKAQPSARIHGVSVQPMARPGIEVIMGMTLDPQFGPVLMFGLGGVFVEVLKDVAFRIVPLTPRDAREMVREIKGFPILSGYRGQEPADIGALEDALLKLSAFVEGQPGLREIDLNPIFAYRDGLLAVDARVILREEGKGA